MTRPTKIISGGQTGADYAGLVAATYLDIHTGGTAPKGFRVCLEDGSDGTNPALADFGLAEHASREYPPRTQQNVQDSDGTVWFGYADSPGGKLTMRCAKQMGKPCLVNPTAEQLREWVSKNHIKVLNVAGNRQSPQNPDIFRTTFETIVEAFEEASAS